MAAESRSATGASGLILGLARRAVSGAPIEEISRGEVSVERGLEGDCKGIKFPRRQLTLLSVEDWLSACAALSPSVELHWTVRRANVLVGGLQLPRGCGSRLRLGDVELEVTAQTYPCAKMERAHPGLLKALGRDWRGGVTAKVLTAGTIAIGDAVAVTLALADRTLRLPG